MFLLSMFVHPSVCHTICLSHIGHLQLPKGEGNAAEGGGFASLFRFRLEFIYNSAKKSKKSKMPENPTQQHSNS